MELVYYDNIVSIKLNEYYFTYLLPGSIIFLMIILLVNSVILLVLYIYNFKKIIFF